MTQLPLGRLGYGAAALGNLYSRMGDDDARRTLEAAWLGGIRYFDTAPHYGLGLSERRLGDFLRTRPREDFVISTKAGRLLEPNPTYLPGELDTEGFAVPAEVGVDDAAVFRGPDEADAGVAVGVLLDLGARSVLRRVVEDEEDAVAVGQLREHAADLFVDRGLLVGEGGHHGEARGGVWIGRGFHKLKAEQKLDYMPALPDRPPKGGS